MRRPIIRQPLVATVIAEAIHRAIRFAMPMLFAAAREGSMLMTIAWIGALSPPTGIRADPAEAVVALI
jgi:hypothetical protein